MPSILPGSASSSSFVSSPAHLGLGRPTRAVPLLASLLIGLLPALSSGICLEAEGGGCASLARRHAEEDDDDILLVGGGGAKRLGIDSAAHLGFEGDSAASPSPSSASSPSSLAVVNSTLGSASASAASSLAEGAGAEAAELEAKVREAEGSIPEVEVCEYEWTKAYKPQYKESENGPDKPNYLGQGAFGTVVRVLGRESKGRRGQFALKETIDDGTMAEEIRTEIYVGALDPMPAFNTPLHEAFRLEMPIQRDDEGNYFQPELYAWTMPMRSGVQPAEHCKLDNKNGCSMKEAMAQVAFGLWRLHTRRILHMDIADKNILARDEEGKHFALIDYGLSQICSDGSEGAPCKSKVGCGSMDYMAPLVAGCWKDRCRSFSYESDWYSFGQLVFEAFFGSTLNMRIFNAYLEKLLADHGDEVEVQFKDWIRVIRTFSARNLDASLAGFFSARKRGGGLHREMKRLFMTTIGSGYWELAKDANRSALQSESIMEHPVLSHAAWLIPEWDLSGSHPAVPTEGREAKLLEFWRRICEEHAEDGARLESCDDIFGSDSKGGLFGSRFSSFSSRFSRRDSAGSENSGSSTSSGGKNTGSSRRSALASLCKGGPSRWQPMSIAKRTGFKLEKLIRLPSRLAKYTKKGSEVSEQGEKKDEDEDEEFVSTKWWEDKK